MIDYKNTVESRYLKVHGIVKKIWSVRILTKGKQEIK
jgi:hypothetical protein